MLEFQSSSLLTIVNLLYVSSLVRGFLVKPCHHLRREPMITGRPPKEPNSSLAAASRVLSRKAPFRSSLRMDSSSSKSFVKYQGLGNDFILVDNTMSSEPIYTPEQAMKICDRNFGIGGDGLIFAMPGTNDCDYTMRIYNSDGSEPQMCGNGIRCMAKYLVEEIEKKSADSDTTYKIWTNAGRIVPKILSENSMITVDMGEPILDALKVPTLLATTEKGSNAAVESPIEIGGKVYKATAVSMGNPHSVIFVDDLDRMDPPFSMVGPLAEKHPQFPEKVNAEFVQVISPTHLKMKVWERGAGPTLACGTGACAVLVAAVLTGRAQRDTDCVVTLPGGDLSIRWSSEDNKLYMSGPAESTFSGEIRIAGL